MSTVESSSETPQGSPASFDLCLVWGDTATQVDRTESFLIARGYAARLDQASGVTSVLLTDTSFRPLQWDVSLAAQFAQELGDPVRLVGGSSPLAGGNAAEPDADSQHVVALVEPDGSCRGLEASELHAAIADIPDRVSGDDRWLVVGKSPGPAPEMLAEIAASALPAAADIQALAWIDQGWFVVDIRQATVPGQPAVHARPEPEQSQRPAAAAALAAAVRAGRKRPVMVIRHSSVDTVVMQPGARDWAEFPLEWGLRRTWVHPRWGVAVVDQDRAVSQFVKAWDHAGGEAEEVNLRALSRRRAMKGEVLSPLLASLSVPPAVAELVLALALSEAGAPTTGPQPALLVGDPQRGGRGWGLAGRVLWGLGAKLPWGANSRTLQAVGTVAGLALGLHIVSQGVSGWDWAGLAAAGLAGLAGSANLAANPIRARLHRGEIRQPRDGQSGVAGVAVPLPGESESR